MMDRTCGICQRPLVNNLVTHTQWYKGRLIVIENVPAWVCEQCGETYYDPDVVDQLQRLIWSDAPPVRTIETSVYDLTQQAS
jgi:YgiT-type zinc finger domain-containing protein